MEERERRRQELMLELTRRFQESAITMRNIAERISEAAKIHNANKQSFDKLSKPLGDCIDSQTGELPFSYLEFLEFTSAEEFERFRNQKKITSQDINQINWENLSKQLLQ